MNKVDAIMILSEAMEELEHVQICTAEVMDKLEKVYDWLHEVTDTNFQPTMQLISQEMERIRANQNRIDRKNLNVDFNEGIILRLQHIKEQRAEQEKRDKIKKMFDSLPF